jgi:hypothetical protein
VIAWSDKDGSISGDLLHQGEKLLICCSIVVVQIIGNIPSNQDSVNFLLLNHSLQILGNGCHDIDVGLNGSPVGENYHVDVPILPQRVDQLHVNPLLVEGSRIDVQCVVPPIGSVSESFLEGNVGDGADLNIGGMVIGKWGGLHCLAGTHDLFEALI